MSSNSTTYRLDARSASTGMFQKVLPFVAVLMLGFFPWVGDIYKTTGISPALILPISIFVGLNLIIGGLLFLFNKSSRQKISVQVLENFVQIYGLSRGVVSIPYSQISQVTVHDLHATGLARLTLVYGTFEQKLSVSGFEKDVATEIQTSIQAKKQSIRLASPSTVSYMVSQTLPPGGFRPQPAFNIRMVIRMLLSMVVMAPIVWRFTQYSEFLIGYLVVSLIWYAVRYLRFTQVFAYWFNPEELVLRQGYWGRKTAVSYSGMNNVVVRQDWLDKVLGHACVVITRGKGVFDHTGVQGRRVRLGTRSPLLGMRTYFNGESTKADSIFFSGVTLVEAEILRDAIITHINSTTHAIKSVL